MLQNFTAQHFVIQAITMSNCRQVAHLYCLFKHTISSSFVENRDEAEEEISQNGWHFTKIVCEFICTDEFVTVKTMTTTTTVRQYTGKNNRHLI